MSTKEQYPSSGRRILIVFSVMTGVLLQTIDSTIANVALPHMQAALGATPESVAWVLTSYIIAAAIATPITGWLDAKFGRRIMYTLALFMFTVSSALCGIANSIELMVLARLVQGIFGAFIMPLGMTILLDSFPPEKRQQSMQIWMGGAMLGPIAGPVLGGWITDNFNWRWVFLVNIPFGVIAVLLSWFVVTSGKQESRRFDLFGFVLLAFGLGCLQLILDRGTQKDWFESREIIIEALVAISAFWMFTVHSFTARAPLLPLAVFKDRNLVGSTLIMFAGAGVVYGVAALFPPMLQHLMGFDTIDAGIMMMPRAFAMLVAMLVAGRLYKRLGARALIAIGMSLTVVSLWMMSGFNLEMGRYPLITAGMVQGFGVGFTMMPLQMVAFETLAPHLRTEGASVYSLGRNLGGSVWISIAGALLAHNVQVSHSDLAAHVTPERIPLLGEGLLAAFGRAGGRIAWLIDAEINRQALMIAYIDDYWTMMWISMLAVPTVLLLRKSRKVATQEAGPPIAVMD